MSSDEHLLAAFTLKLGQELRYFELVCVINGQDTRRCYVCIGKHSILFVKLNLDGLIHGGGEVVYASIIKVLKDSQSRRHLLLLLNDNRPEQWKSDRLFIQSDNRELFLQHFRCTWQVDRMWRLGKVDPLPLFVHSVTRETSQLESPQVDAFLGFRWQVYQGYRLMIPYDFETKPNALQAEETGEYVNKDGTIITLHVHEPLSLEQLQLLGRDNIRWVAEEYKSQLVQAESHFYILKNNACEKRMNLIGDISAWMAWEIIIQTRNAMVVCLLLRRQYIPPICSSAQDLAVVLRCPSSDAQALRNFHKSFHVAHLIADSVCSDAPDMAVYSSLVQAKLDALRFDEEGFDWVGSHLKLRPKLHHQAKIFVRKLMHLFIEDGAFKECQELLSLPASQVLANPMPGEDWGELDAEARKLDIGSFLRDSALREMGEGLPKLTLGEVREEGGRTFDENLQAIHQWQSRVAHYFAWAVDGGLLGARFNLAKIIENSLGLLETNAKTLWHALNFMLHLRSRDMTKAWPDMQLVHVSKEYDMSCWRLNERVMFALLSTDFLRKQYGRKSENDYVVCLAKLLDSVGSVTLKAYICRLIMEMYAGDTEKNSLSAEAIATVVGQLVKTMAKSGFFLATYASAALVNMSSDNAEVKHLLHQMGILRICMSHLKTKDDDLICYTLMLLSNLTKEAHTRSLAAQDGFLALLYDMLTSSYHQCRSDSRKDSDIVVGGGSAFASHLKERILTQLCINIGQFCNDAAFHEELVTTYPHAMQCVMYIFEHCYVGSPLESKAMFALKQLCANRADLKLSIGKQVIPKLLKELADKNQKIESGSVGVDYLNQATLLLQMMASVSDNVMLMQKEGSADVLIKLGELPLIKKVGPLRDRVLALGELLGLMNV